MTRRLGWGFAVTSPLALGLAFAACRSSEVPSSLPASAGADAGAVSIALPAAGDGGGVATGKGTRVAGPVVALAYSDEGALVVQTEAGLTSVAADGTRTELPLPPHASATLSGTLGTSIAVQVDDDVLLIGLAPLSILLRAHGRPIGVPEIGMVETTTRGDHDLAVRLVAPGTRRIVRLKLEDGLDGRVEELALAPGGLYAVVTVNSDQDGETTEHAFSYGLSTGRRIAEVMPLNKWTLLPTATFAGDHEIGFRGGDLVELDLESGATVKKVPFPCKRVEGMSERGNPILDASGTRLMTTCNSDGVLLDAHTFRRVRTYKSITPGCDNGSALPAHFREDGKQLIIEGCGGEAHLDLATGKYACGDSEGVMGAEYMMEPPGPGAPPPVSPSHAANPNVPSCRAGGADFREEEAEVSPHWRLRLAEKSGTLVGAGSDGKAPTIELPGLVGYPAVSATEDRVAAVEGEHVVVRALPSGNVLNDLAF